MSWWKPSGSPLESHAVGTSSNDSIVPCATEDPKPDPPPAATPAPPFALALSGGGFRATLCAMGVARFLADAGLLSRLRFSSSVSGGSIANGILACGYRAVADHGFTGEAFDAHVLDPLARRISRTSLMRKLLLGVPRTLGRRTRTDLLAEALDEWWFDGRTLADLPAEVRWIFNASNMTTGVGFGFERDVVGDYVFGRLSTTNLPLRLATAAAASAAVPGAFAEVVIDAPFPCAGGREARLLDGGAYDNSGLQPLDGVADAFLVAVNAGGTFRVGKLGRVPIVRDLQRANAILYKQSTGLRRQFMVDRFQAFEQVPAGQTPPSFGREGVLFSLGTSMEEVPGEWAEGRPEADAQQRQELADVPTSFDRFAPDLCERLIYRGWWLTGATMSQYHRDRLPATLPAWRPLS
jgi:NTE family protein